MYTQFASGFHVTPLTIVSWFAPQLIRIGIGSAFSVNIYNNTAIINFIINENLAENNDISIWASLVVKQLPQLVVDFECQWLMNSWLQKKERELEWGRVGWLSWK